MHDVHRLGKYCLITDVVTNAPQIFTRHIPQCLAREYAVNRVRHSEEVLERSPLRNLNDAILDEARIRHEDGDHMAFAHRQELQQAKCRLCCLRREHERNIVRHIFDKTRRLLEHLVEAPHACTVPFVNTRALRLRYGSDRQKSVDIEPIAL